MFHFRRSRHGSAGVESDALSFEVLDYGATLRSLRVKDAHGAWVDVVLGYDSLAEYEQNDGYLGAVVGRVCNRIAGAEFELDGNRYPLYQNDGVNHLHGGKRGFDKYVWAVEELPDGLRLTRHLARRRGGLSRHDARFRDLPRGRRVAAAGLRGGKRPGYALQSDEPQLFQSQRRRLCTGSHASNFRGRGDGADTRPDSNRGACARGRNRSSTSLRQSPCAAICPERMRAACIQTAMTTISASPGRPA